MLLWRFEAIDVRIGRSLLIIYVSNELCNRIVILAIVVLSIPLWQYLGLVIRADKITSTMAGRYSLVFWDREGEFVAGRATVAVPHGSDVVRLIPVAVLKEHTESGAGWRNPYEAAIIKATHC
jgi:hypothetical protein